MKVLLSLILVDGMQAAVPSQIRVISREMMSMVEEPKQAVARTAAEWAGLWRQHAGDKPLPVVDFGSRTVVAVVLGTRSSAGFAAGVPTAGHRALQPARRPTAIAEASTAAAVGRAHGRFMAPMMGSPTLCSQRSTMRPGPSS